MNVEDKRRERNDEEALGNFVEGIVVEFIEGLGFTPSLKEYKIGFILQRDTVPDYELPERQNMTPVAFFSGEFAWLNSDLWVRCVDATVKIDHYDQDEEMPFIKVVKGVT